MMGTPSVLSHCNLSVQKLPVCQAETALLKGLTLAMPSDKAETHLQESQSRAKIPQGFADALGCSSMAREKTGTELKLRYYSSW